MAAQRISEIAAKKWLAAVAFAFLTTLLPTAGPAVAQSPQATVGAAQGDVGAQRQKRRKSVKKPAKAPVAKRDPREREPFTAEEQRLAAIPGIANARIFSDSPPEEFAKMLPTEPGPWLILSSGGGDGAFGAGLLSGWSETGKRPQFSVVTGVSTGALMAPYAFIGSSADPDLRKAYTSINASDIFEAGGKGESFLDTWPLKELIDRQVTPQVLEAVAAEHRKGRRLLVLTTNLDAERYTIWNMGVIADKGGEEGLKLFRKVLLASTSIPGMFPPVLIDVEANGHRFQEMHADGGLGAQFFVAPEAYLFSDSDLKLPATDLYIVVNTQLQPEVSPTERATVNILGRSISAAVKTATRTAIDRSQAMARRAGIGFHIALIEGFSFPPRGAFDPDYMKALFEFGEARGKSDTPFRNELRQKPATGNSVGR